MNLDTARKWVVSNFNIFKSFKYIGSRNQIEEFNGKIISIYPKIFLIKTDNNNYKCFSYSDVVIGSLVIIE